MLLGCIADDFTGATDLANNLVRSGMRTVQMIGVPQSPLHEEVDAVVVALKSRTIPARDAVAQSLAALDWLQKLGCRQFYFKYCSTFDSTQDGNIGPVAEALMQALDCDFTIACPAFPDNQRTIFNGYLFVGQAPLNESGMRHHPLTPMTDANLVRVLQGQTQRKVGLVNYQHVAQGADAIRARFAELRSSGIGIAIVDATSNDDLMQIGSALSNMKLVTAGSGVAIGLSRNFASEGLPRPEVSAAALPRVQGYRAVVAGSCSVVTNAQVKHFKAAGRAAFGLDPLKLANAELAPTDVLAWAKPLLPNGPVLVYSTSEPDALHQVQARLGVEKAGSLVEGALAEVARQLVSAGVNQLIVAGGETSGAVVQALNVKALRIGPQIDPGVPWTATIGDNPVLLALKSGNFGTPDFFTKAFSQLEQA
jgi:3-dehydrotetronate 4-kinase